MTGSGTNTYLLGLDEIVVIDPGPAIASHAEAIVHHAPGPIRWILVTHTHLDHSPAARGLAARTGAKVAGRPAPHYGRQDREFTPDRCLAHEEPILAAGIELTAIHTPGHASNHLCYLAATTGRVFTGDHIIDGSTVVIDPPDGNMTDYLRSLAVLKNLDAKTLMPGHGAPLTSPREAIDALIAHRLRREAKILSTLDDEHYCSIEELVAQVYDDVDRQLHGIAARSLLAHLIKLESENRATRDGATWRRN
jgi:glyoxylase-like metal-dependent hydrolase (beta-lactamase superfamily II)